MPIVFLLVGKAGPDPRRAGGGLVSDFKVRRRALDRHDLDGQAMPIVVQGLLGSFTCPVEPSKAAVAPLDRRDDSSGGGLGMVEGESSAPSRDSLPRRGPAPPPQPPANPDEGDDDIPF